MAVDTMADLPKFNLTPELMEPLMRQGTDYIDLVMSAYRASCLSLYKRISPFFPSGASRFLDIGCGTAGIDLMIASCMPDTHVTLLDKNEVIQGRDIGYGSAESFVGYCDFRAAKKMFADNAMLDRLTCCDINWQPFPSGKFDVIMSFYSWCFHYPADTYAEQVYNALDNHGVVIVDVRNDAPEPFKNGHTIFNGKKHRCIVYRKTDGMR